MVKMIQNLPLSNFQHLHMKDSRDLRSHGGRKPFGPFGWYAVLEAGGTLMDYQVKEASGTERTSFVYWYPDVFVTRPSTPGEVCSLMNEHCHRAVLRSETTLYHYYLPKQFYDAFNYEKSWFDRQADAEGNERPDGCVTFIRTAVLNARKIGNAPIFRVNGEPEDIGVRQSVYVSDEFYDIYHATGCTGLIFEDVECV